MRIVTQAFDDEMLKMLGVSGCKLGLWECKRLRECNRRSECKRPLGRVLALGIAALASKLLVPNSASKLETSYHAALVHETGSSAEAWSFARQGTSTKALPLGEQIFAVCNLYSTWETPVANIPTPPDQLRGSPSWRFSQDCWKFLCLGNCITSIDWSRNGNRSTASSMKPSGVHRARIRCVAKVNA